MYLFSNTIDLLSLAAVTGVGMSLLPFSLDLLSNCLVAFTIQIPQYNTRTLISKPTNSKYLVIAQFYLVRSQIQFEYLSAMCRPIPLAAPVIKTISLLRSFLGE